MIYTTSGYSRIIRESVNPPRFVKKMEKFLKSAESVNVTYPMRFGTTKHDLLQSILWDMKKCADFHDMENSEFSELFSVILNVFDKCACSLRNNVQVQCELIVRNKRADVVIYIPFRLCIVIELKTHLATKVSARHRREGLERFELLQRAMYIQTENNTELNWISFVGIYIMRNIIMQQVRNLHVTL